MLPAYPHVLFAQPPLRLVLAQVRFPVLLRFGNSTFVAPFQEGIQAEYPRRSQEQSIALQVSPAGLQQSIAEQQWRFTSRDEHWSIVLSSSALTIECRRYSSGVDLLERFGRVLEVAKETLSITERARLGLRYINEFRREGTRTLQDWGAILPPELVGFAATNLFDSPVERMVQEVRIQQPNGTLDIRHGLLTGALVEPAPSNPPPEERFYLLDLDYYDVAERELDVPRTIAQLREYNDTLYRFFRWTIGEQLFKELEPLNGS